MLYQCHPLQRVDMSSVFSGNTFRRGKLNNALTTVKLVLGTEGDIYAGGGEHLTRLSFLESQHTPVVRALVLCSYSRNLHERTGLRKGETCGRLCHLQFLSVMCANSQQNTEEKPNMHLTSFCTCRNI